MAHSLHPRRVRRRLLVLGLVALAACDKSYENPFDATARTQAPATAADLAFTSNSHLLTTGSPRDLFAIEESGAGTARLTTCSGGCDILEGSFAPDRRRVALRQVANDTNGDRRLTAADGVSLVVNDLARGVQGNLAGPEVRVTGVDWSPGDDVLVYSAFGETATGGLDDLFRIDPNGQNVRNMTSSPTIVERRPRMHPGGTALTYERIEPGQRGQVWVFQSSTVQNRVTAAGPAGDPLPLPLTGYTVGSDADPAFSPDGRQIVFRRLRALGNGGLGSWDILKVTYEPTGLGSSLTTVATGPAFRGAPDWGSGGIAFQEVDAGRAYIVIVSPEGANRRIPLTAASSVEINHPRWLPLP